MAELAGPWPPPVGAYAEERELFRLLQNMLEELIIHQPDDPIQFMINHLKQNNDDVKPLKRWKKVLQECSSCAMCFSCLTKDFTYKLSKFCHININHGISQT